MDLNEILAKLHNGEKLSPEEMAVIAGLAERATRDSLTGAFNRGQFDEDLGRVVERAERNGPKARFGLVIGDIDHFKEVNDTYGHPIGDDVLKIVATTLRVFDKSYRIGGEEFAILAGTETTEQGRALAERLRLTIQNQNFRDREGNRIPVTISAGVAGYEKGITARTLYERADKALYKAKNTGRNKVVVHGD